VKINLDKLNLPSKRQWSSTCQEPDERLKPSSPYPANPLPWNLVSIPNLPWPLFLSQWPRSHQWSLNPMESFCSLCFLISWLLATDILGRENGMFKELKVRENEAHSWQNSQWRLTRADTTLPLAPAFSLPLWLLLLRAFFLCPSLTCWRFPHSSLLGAFSSLSFLDDLSHSQSFNYNP
jgi:hypothetical protein